MHRPTRLTAILLYLSACAPMTAEDAGSQELKQVVMNGAVHKGPFVLGSTITVSPLDAAANPTGETFLTQTSNDKGEFSVSFQAVGLVDISGVGFYYNEVTGGLSGASLTLRALYVVENEGPQAAYVNLVTHLTALRVKRLVLEGAPFADARAQAEAELRDALAIALPGFDPASPGISMNILGGDTPANAYLLAVSAVLAQAGGADAGLQELLNFIATDLEEDGALGATNTARVTEGLLALDADAVMVNLRARLDTLGSSATVPDLHAILDQDRDGVVNADDRCPKVADPDQIDSDADGRGDACDDCPATPCAADELCLPTATSAIGAGLCLTSCGDLAGMGGLGTCEGTDQCLLVQGGTLVQPLQVCAPPCDPLGAGCGAEQKCISHYTLGGDFVCAPATWTPPVSEGGQCNGNVENQCEAGLACTSCPSTAFEYCCRAYCDIDVPSSCSGACERPSWFGAPTNVGVCHP